MTSFDEGVLKDLVDVEPRAEPELRPALHTRPEPRAKPLDERVERRPVAVSRLLDEHLGGFGVHRESVLHTLFILFIAPRNRSRPRNPRRRVGTVDIVSIRIRKGTATATRGLSRKRAHVTLHYLTVNLLSS